MSSSLTTVNAGTVVRQAVAANTEAGQVCAVYLKRRALVWCASDVGSCAAARHVDGQAFARAPEQGRLCRARLGAAGLPSHTRPGGAAAARGAGSQPCCDAPGLLPLLALRVLLLMACSFLASRGYFTRAVKSATDGSTDWCTAHGGDCPARRCLALGAGAASA